MNSRKHLVSAAFIAGSIGLSACVPSVESIIGGDLDDMFAEYDVDRDNRIGWEEYARSKEDEGEIPERENFDGIDKNGDGYLVREEIIDRIEEVIAE